MYLLFFFCNSFQVYQGHIYLLVVNRWLFLLKISQDNTLEIKDNCPSIYIL